MSILDKAQQVATIIDQYRSNIDGSATVINIPKGVSSIGASRLSYFPDVTTINLTDDVTYIGEYAFTNNKKLTDVTKTENVTTIDEGAFRECRRLYDFSETPNLRYIGSYAFFGCLALRSFSIPDSVQYIGELAFSVGSQSTSLGLKTLEIGALNESTWIGNSAFQYCDALENVTILNGFNADNLNLSYSKKYSHDTILSWFNALADRTGKTAYTLTIGSTNLAKMTAEETAIATNKNWNIT